MATNVVKLRKGESINLNKTFTGETKFVVGLSWDFKDNSKAIDLDVMALLLNDKVDNGGKVIDMDYLVGYPSNDPSRENFDKITFRNPDGTIGFQDPKGACKHSGDCRDGKKEGIDEMIAIDFNKMDPRVKSVLVLVSIYDIDNTGLNFGQVKNANCSLFTGTSTDIPSLVYDLTEDMSGVRNLEFVEIYQHNNEWKMKALGERGDDSIEVELKKFGVPC